jgi:hypothetical protein
MKKCTHWKNMVLLPCNIAEHSYIMNIVSPYKNHTHTSVTIHNTNACSNSILSYTIFVMETLHFVVYGLYKPNFVLVFLIIIIIIIINGKQPFLLIFKCHKIKEDRP